MIILYLLVTFLTFSFSVKATNDLEDDDEFFGTEPVQIEKIPLSKSAPKNDIPSREIDGDEFVGQQESSSQKKKVQPKQINPTTKGEQDFMSLARKWWVETCAFAVFVLYWINFWIGSAKNERIVTRWGTLYKQILLDNFAKVSSIFLVL